MSSKHIPQRPAPIDPLVAKRLEALNRRQGQPLPPPAAADPATAASGRAAGARPTGGAPRTGRRTKPARKAKATALAVSVVSTGAMAALFSQQDTSSDSVVLTSGTLAPVLAPSTASVVSTPTAVTTPIITTVQPAATTPATAAPVTAAPVTQAPAQGGIVDGTYLGQGSRNRWGTVQVQAVYSGGQLVDVQVLQYPDGDRRSLRISQYSLPRLVDQALSAQGSAISGISGATYTSRSYVASLQSAIDAAKAASGVSG